MTLTNPTTPPIHRPEMVETLPPTVEALDELVDYYGGQFKATDIHLKAGSPPRLSVNGELLIDNAQAASNGIDSSTMLAWAAALGGPAARAALEEGIEGGAWVAGQAKQFRYRATFRRQTGGIAATIRVIPLESPSTRSVNAPQALVDLLDSPGGLVVVCGATGAGKSFLLNALLDHANHHLERHIFTIEDPIEIVHAERRALVSQLEIGRDVDTYERGIKYAMRSSPHIIMLGELLDNDTCRAAIDAAGKGHLVLTTFHASSAVDAINTLVGQFPATEQNAIRTRLSQTLRAIVVQRLVPTADETRRIPARELMLTNSAIASNIRESMTQMIGNQMTPANGMITLDADLKNLVGNAVITAETAIEYANDRAAMQAELGHLVKKEAS